MAHQRKQLRAALGKLAVSAWHLSGGRQLERHLTCVYVVVAL